MRLEDIVTVIVGRNISRVSKEQDVTIDTYTYEHLMNDLDGGFPNSNAIGTHRADDTDNHLSNPGEVVFSFVSSKAAIVSDLNKGKLINQNFAKLIIENKKMDHRYLCYVLNESDAIKKQMAISMQGSTVRKLTPAILKALDIKLPSKEKQQKIGKAYMMIKKRQALAKKQIDLEETLYLETLKKSDQSQKSGE